MPDFVSVKLLLVLLCVILVIGILVVSEGLGRLLHEMEVIKEAMIDDLPEATKTAIQDAEFEREKSLELEMLDTQLNSFKSDKATPGSKREPFVFHIDAEVAELAEQLKPDSMSGWKKSEE